MGVQSHLYIILWLGLQLSSSWSFQLNQYQNTTCTIYANVSSNIPATGTPHHEDFNCKSDPSCFVLITVAEEVAGYWGSDSELCQALDGGFTLACRLESPRRASETRAWAVGGRSHFTWVKDDSKATPTTIKWNAQVLQIYGWPDHVPVQEAGEFEKGVIWDG